MLSSLACTTHFKEDSMRNQITWMSDEGVDTQAFCDNRNAFLNCQKIIQCHAEGLCLLPAQDTVAALGP